MRNSYLRACSPLALRISWAHLAKLLTLTLCVKILIGCGVSWASQAAGHESRSAEGPMKQISSAADTSTSGSRNLQAMENFGACSLLAGCSTPISTGPTDDRYTIASGGAGSVELKDKPLYSAENVGRPGYYTVKPGDTLFRIAHEYGKDWKDLARWNNIDNSNPMKVGQVLRVISPAGAAPATRATSNMVATTQPSDSRNSYSVARTGACGRNLMHLASRLQNYTHPALANVRNAVLTSPLQKQSAQSALRDAAAAEQSAASAARTANSTDGRSGLTSIQRVDNGTLPLSWPCEGIHANAVCAYIIHKWEALAYREIAAMATSCP